MFFIKIFCDFVALSMLFTHQSSWALYSRVVISTSLSTSSSSLSSTRSCRLCSQAAWPRCSALANAMMTPLARSMPIAYCLLVYLRRTYAPLLIWLVSWFISRVLNSFVLIFSHSNLGDGLFAGCLSTSASVTTSLGYHASPSVQAGIYVVDTTSAYCQA